MSTEERARDGIDSWTLDRAGAGTAPARTRLRKYLFAPPHAPADEDGVDPPRAAQPSTYGGPAAAVVDVAARVGATVAGVRNYVARFERAIELGDARLIERLEAEEDEPDGDAQADADPAPLRFPAEHLVLVPSPKGYALRVCAGEPPPPGSDVTLDGDDRAFRVLRIGASPLPGDSRRCAFLETP